MGATSMNGADATCIRVWIGGKAVFQDCQENIVGLQVNKASEGICQSATLTVYDDKNNEIEMMLRSNQTRECVFQYGWSSRLSLPYRCQITDYHKEFRGSSGVTIRIDMTGGTVLDMTNPPKQGVVFQNKSPVEIAQLVAKTCGWNIKFIDKEIETIPDPNRESQHKSFTWSNETGMSFIQTKLQPYCTVPGKGKVRGVWKWDVKTEKVDFYFMAISDKMKSAQDLTYIVGGDDERIIDWRPEFHWGRTQLAGAGLLVGKALDKQSNQQFTVKVKGPDKVPFTLERVVPVSGDNLEAVKKELIALYKDAYKEIGKATMTIVGNPYWYPTDWVTVVAYDKHGQVDNSSGVYFVKGGNDVITNAGFVSTMDLQMVRSADGSVIYKDPIIEIDPTSEKVGPEKRVGDKMIPSDAEKGTTKSEQEKRGRSDYTFPVDTPKKGDIIIAEGPVNRIGTYIDSKYVLTETEDGENYVDMKTFIKDAKVSYRRPV